MQSDLLSKHPAADLKVYAVWFNMIWSDARGQWSADILTDRRVTHHWDERKTVGQWYAQNVTRGGTAGSHAVVWDAYFLYGPEAVWQSDHPPAALRWGSPIVTARDELQQGLTDLLKNQPDRPE